MTLDLSDFRLINVLDTCGVWNILSSKSLFQSAIQSKCHFSITQFVEYECLRKPRKDPLQTDLELKARLEKQIAEGTIKVCSLSIADLQHVDVLERRKRLGRGELSTIVFAKQISQSLITDDQAARKLAGAILGSGFVQTTPHLLGWMFYCGILTDGLYPDIVKEHEYFGRPLTRYFKQVYFSALEYRLKSNAKDHPQ